MAKLTKIRAEITQNKVLQELANIAFSDGTRYAEIVEKPYMKPIFDNEGKKTGEEKVFYKDVELKETKELTGSINNPYEGLTREQVLKIASEDDG